MLMGLVNTRWALIAAVCVVIPCAVGVGYRSARSGPSTSDQREALAKSADRAFAEGDVRQLRASVLQLEKVGSGSAELDRARELLSWVIDEVPTGKSRIVGRYSGHYSSLPQWATIETDVDREMNQWCGWVRERCGFVGAGPLVRIVDRAPDAHIPWINTHMMVVGGQMRAVVEIGSDILWTRAFRLSELVRHEVCHGFMMDALRGRMTSVPMWMYEGVACWCEANPEGKLIDHAIAGSLDSRDIKPEEWVGDI